MAQLDQSYNSEENNESSGFSVIPEGNYHVMIDKSEWKDTKAGTGKYINFQMKVVDGEYAGRVLFDILNLINPNPVAVDIARKTLNSMCQACGLTNVEDTDELHGIVFEVKVKVEEGTGDNPDRNKIAAYLPAEDYENPWD